ncbi:Aste57867_20661 [Aphanomyces stellatus]|nr:hypothetical protein As57867_020593 [Aphanomyces stellatus]KAF0707650.1 hypothetical protein As57867_006547 [Aphanomyces stellatus]KAF0708644.1 hypothetical protein As57867_006263 [Aphanomyces stellatus]KAF0711416.1 hypothetical protein As57867_005273 [Aphanomyces stellatus]KAF0712243.1 hypothetical protein As57867_004879 [Aphanomyces stellatus]
MAQLVITNNITPAQVFNMDETSFESKSATRRVVGLRGSSNVWSHQPQFNFHLTIIVAANAAGLVTPPAFVLPGKSVTRDVLTTCAVPSATVTCAPKGFVNHHVFNNWLTFFAHSVPPTTPRPLVLVCDGCSSHFTAKTYDIAMRHQILIVRLPANATHLVQPLDVAVFKPYKARIRELVHERMVNETIYRLTKKNAIEIASKAFVDAIVGRQENIVEGFCATGLFPPSMPKMQARLSKFDSNAMERQKIESWLKHKEEIRSEVLVLPMIEVKPAGRKTVDTNFTLFNQQALETIRQAKRTIKKKSSSIVNDEPRTVSEEVLV